MSELIGNLQDPRTLSSSAALVATAASAIYFYNEIQTLKANIAELRDHMSNIIPMVDPKIRDTIKALNSRMDATQRDVNLLSHNIHHVAQEGTRGPLSLPAYKRVTPKTVTKVVDRPPIKAGRPAPKPKGKEKASVPTSPRNEDDGPEEDSDVLAAVQAMQG
jgi:hypothetical protein